MNGGNSNESQEARQRERAHEQPLPPPDGASKVSVADSFALAKAGPWLAPLAGYSDLAFRLLCRAHGAAVACTEMVSVKGFVHGNGPTRSLLQTCPADTPLVVQLFGADPALMRVAMEKLTREFAWFDLNMGCPVPKVMKTGCGAAMLRDPQNALAVARTMIEVAPPGHVGFKLRLGVEKGDRVFFDLARRLEDAGAGWITLHPRAAKDGYSGVADMEALRELARVLSIPVLASGDVLTPQDAAQRLDECSATGVMFARGALANPRVFDGFWRLRRGEIPQPSDIASLFALAREHIALDREWTSLRAPFGRMRAIVMRYARHAPGSRLLRQDLGRSRTFEELEEMLARFAGEDASRKFANHDG